MSARNVFSAFSYALTRHVRLHTQTVRLQPANCVGHEEELRLHRTRLQLAPWRGSILSMSISIFTGAPPYVLRSEAR